MVFLSRFCCVVVDDVLCSLVYIRTVTFVNDIQSLGTPVRIKTLAFAFGESIPAPYILTEVHHDADSSYDSII